MNTEALEMMNQNKDLTQTIKSYITNCDSICEICLAAAGIADHVLALVDPDFCGVTDYHEFWVEASDCSPIIYDAIDKAFEEANNN